MATSPHGAEAADNQIAERITNALVVKNVSILTLSEETGIAYNTLRRSLKGHRSLSFKEFGKIAEVLEVQPSALLPSELMASQDAA